MFLAQSFKLIDLFLQLLRSRFCRNKCVTVQMRVNVTGQTSWFLYNLFYDPLIERSGFEPIRANALFEALHDTIE